MEKHTTSVMPTAAPEASAPRREPNRPEPKPKTTPKSKTAPNAGVLVTLAGVCVLGGASFVLRPQTGTPALAAETASPIVGAWTDGDEEWLVLNADGSGARTRPDPTWGNRRYAFRWRAVGGSLQLTEQSIKLPGGSQMKAGDASEAFSVSGEGKSLTLGALKFSRHKP